jgi:hypothetical protein
MPDYAPRVFASYSHVDAERVAPIVAWLELDGANVYQDVDDLTAGRDWSVQIGRAIAEADAVIVFLGATGATDYQKAEVVAAVAAGVATIPAFLAGFPADLPPPGPLAAIEAVDLRDPRRFTTQVRRLADAVREARSARRSAGS